MTEETIFDTPSTPSLPTEVEELVGEGKKYATVEEALKSVPHAQTHIQKLEEEMKAMKEELAKRKAAEELLAELKNQKAPEATPPVELNEEMLSKAVEKALSAKEAQKQALSNIEVVKKTFNEKFGEKGPEQYRQLAVDSGLPLEYLNQLAATSPGAILKLAGLEAKSFIPGKMSQSVNVTDSTPPAPSARIKPVGTSTKELVAAWKAAGEMIKRD